MSCAVRGAEQKQADFPVTPEEARWLKEVEAKETVKEALEFLQQKVDEDASAAVWFELGQLQRRAGHLQEAAEAFTVVLQEYPKLPQARLQLAAVLYEDNQFAEAVAYLQPLINNPAVEPAAFYSMLGSAYLALQHLQAAETAFRQGILHAPGAPELQLGLVHVLLQQEREPAAIIQLLKEQLTKEPQRADLWAALARADALNGDNDEALMHLETARRLGLEDAETLTALASHFLKKGLAQEALDVYIQAAALPEAPIDRLLLAARQLVALEKFEQVKLLLDAIKQRTDLTPEQIQQEKMLKAELFQAEGETAKALALYRDLLENQPLNAHLLLKSAELLRITEDFDAALELYNRLLRLQTDNRYEGLLGKAQVLVAQEEFAEASVQLKKALEIRQTAAVQRYMAQVQAFADQHAAVKRMLD